MPFANLINTLLAATIGRISDYQVSLHAPSVCGTIEASISRASSVHYFGTSSYNADIGHYVSSSSEPADCSVQPGSIEDLSTIIKIIGAGGTPFAVKGGGHTGNKGFSSTAGVMIAMTRFNQTTYHPESNTADVGTGSVWDQVYEDLSEFGVGVAGGRDTGVGVAGFTLGGGYSWFSNERGLAIDNVVAFELVLANGTVATASNSVNQDLFFALRGGLNNFGIVTKITFQTFPLGMVWGGPIFYFAHGSADVVAATVDFAQNNKDQKASIITTFDNVIGDLPVPTVILFYNGPSRPKGVFDKFFAIKGLDIELTKTRTIADLVQSLPSNDVEGKRGIYSTINVPNLSQRVVASAANQSSFWAKKSLEDFKFPFLISAAIEPFTPSYYSHSKGGAYPHDSSLVLYPIFLFFAWYENEASADPYYFNAIREASQAIADTAIAEGQRGVNEIVYSNYALPDTPIEQLWGSNVGTLKTIKKKYDPGNVMGQAGGFKI